MLLKMVTPPGSRVMHLTHRGNQRERLFEDRLDPARAMKKRAVSTFVMAPRSCVVRDANMGRQLAGSNCSWCPELESRTTHRIHACS